MQKFVAVLGLLCVPYVYAESIEGSYSVADEITSFSSEESEIQSTYVKISRSAGNYSVEGLIWGANFHVCHIASPIEGVGGPLQMNYVDNKLVYSYSEAEYNINCELEFSFKDNSLTIKDSNHHCSEYVFYCGARVGLDKVELPKVAQDCP
ncbi:hypothetical protein JS84_19785 [Vibrio vulnificus]|uniref:hypothetical protein n=1 Tax=Vibrio vulnificus TaxID=672 RepID=UPI00044DB2E4|nr:hypothetical protein [Vibrio vulnificus]EWS66958.1 hypothetical protein Y702_23685 [Vibrio vulnificus BAA87]KFK57608.1 hypothetical protein JS83_23090 [Vibrio vulnificus]KFK62840.1 hypothetical protein JS84_19785 [Vibrio vulnificus]KFK67298.1 hypothetical protein JS85_20825 [Vibrio vulnificus]NHE84492.1 hypothetical protein [Vibrio vulnificus]